MAREDPQLKLRLSPEMKEHIVKAARENNRSVNAEIVARLDVSVEADRMEWKEVNLMSELLDQLRQSNKEARYQNEVMRWLVDQQQASHQLLEAVAASDGNLDPEFLDMLRGILARRGSEPSNFPKHPDQDSD